MIRVAVSVEGQTEDEFFRQILVPYFRNYNIEMVPIIVTTSKEKCGRKRKGGCINLDRIKNEIKKLLPSFDYVSTFYDLYGFDVNEDLNADELEQKIHEIFSNNPNLIPYVQQYEFETLLFSKPSYYEEFFDDVNAKIAIEQIIASCGGVEKINNSPQTAPSKRIKKFFDDYDDNYDKFFHGPAIIDDIGLDVIMKECSRFSTWIQKIKNLSSKNAI